MKFKLKYLRYILLLCVIIISLTSCDTSSSFPYHSVWEGKEPLVIYKAERVDDIERGTWKYGVSDVSGKGWTYLSFQRFQLGDTLYISNIRD